VATGDVVFSVLQGVAGVVFIVVAVASLRRTGRRQPEQQSAARARTLPRAAYWLYGVIGVLFIAAAVIRLLR
jgi:threonine/homoserine/homoserine lactone efflux protein